MDDYISIYCSGNLVEVDQDEKGYSRAHQNGTTLYLLKQPVYTNTRSGNLE